MFMVVILMKILTKILTVCYMKEKDVHETIRPPKAGSSEVQEKKENGQVCCPTSHVCDGKAMCEAHKCNYKLRGIKARSVTGNVCDNK
jgi:hypothetical protein